MDEVDLKDMAVRDEKSAPPSTVLKVKKAGIDLHSREAFELLKLGEAICSLQADQRKMRLNAEDMRFERDRYKASAAAFQEKLSAALQENNRLRDLREAIRALSLQHEADSAQIARVESEKANLACTLHEIQVQAEGLRQENAKMNAALRESEELLNLASDASDQLLRELEGVKVQAEQMRLAFIDIARELMIQIESINQGSAD